MLEGGQGCLVLGAPDQQRTITFFRAKVQRGAAAAAGGGAAPQREVAAARRRDHQAQVRGARQKRKLSFWELRSRFFSGHPAADSVGVPVIGLEAASTRAFQRCMKQSWRIHTIRMSVHRPPSGGCGAMRIPSSTSPREVFRPLLIVS